MQSADLAGRNHPWAVRMGVIAFLSQTTTFACMFGSFGVVLASVEAKMGVGRELSSLGVPLVSVMIALMAPIVGILAGRMSIRTLMILGAMLGAAGYALLAAATSITTNLIAYGLLIGPGICLSATVLPSALVTRWFAFRRGRALGFVHMPILLVAVPLLSALVLRSYGLSTVYLMLAALMASLVIPLLFVVDFPPSAIDPSGEDMTAEAVADPELSTAAIARAPRFWALMLAMSSIFAGAVMLSAHLVPMVGLWGVDATHAAGLLTFSSIAGMAGTILFGWLADRLGGRIALAIACFDSAVLWALLLLHPPYPVLTMIIALIGMHGAAALSTFGMALSELFGQASFGRAFGLGNFACLPFTVLVVPLAAAAYVRTGSYDGALGGQAVFLSIGLLLALAAGGGRKAPPRRL